MRLPIAILLLVGITASGSWAQSLADVAKAEAARRAALAAPVKVIKPEDLKTDDTAPAGAASPTSATSTAATSTSTTTADKDKPIVKDEAYWRGRMRVLTAKFQSDFSSAEAVHVRYGDAYARYEAQFVPDPLNGAIIQSARAATLETEMRRLDAEWKQLTAAADADKVAIDDLKEEGRKANVLPGWLR